MKKSLIPVAIILSSILAFSVQAAEWKQDEKGWYYEKDDGSRLVNQWFVDPANNYQYHFDESGYMNTGKTCVDGVWHYFNDSGEMLYNYDSPDGFVSTEDGVVVSKDAPGITVKICAGYSQQESKNRCIAAIVTNLGKNRTTVFGDTKFKYRGVEIPLHAVDYKETRFDADITSVELPTNEHYTFIFARMDNAPININPEEAELYLEFECDGKKYYSWQPINNMDTDIEVQNVFHCE